MKILSLLTFTIFALPFSLMAGEFDLPGPIILDNGTERWTIEAQTDVLNSKLSFTYASGAHQVTAWIPSNTYSDLAPSAVLVDGSPLLVWSALENAASDSDIYYSRWQQAGWSTPKRVHVDNSDPDMLPELSIDQSGNVNLKWWQNIGIDVIQRSASFQQGEFRVQEDVSKRGAGSLIQKLSLSGFYAGMSKRKSDDPLICIAYGDSITQGLKRSFFGQEWGVVSPVNGAQFGGYVAALKAKLIADIEVVKIYNQGVRGELTTQGVSRLGSVLAKHSDANCILIMHGANDRYAGFHPVSTRVNINSMAVIARAASVVPIVATITPNTNIGGIEPFNTEIRSYASAVEISLADQYNATIPNWNSNTSGDGLHLSDQGYAVVAGEWNRVLRENPLIFPNPVVISPVLLLLLGE
jgi:lysophospholipase L1-like esterase